MVIPLIFILFKFWFINILFFCGGGCISNGTIEGSKVCSVFFVPAFTSVYAGSNPTWDQSLACGLIFFSPYLTAWVFPMGGLKRFSSSSLQNNCVMYPLGCFANYKIQRLPFVIPLSLSCLMCSRYVCFCFLIYFALLQFGGESAHLASLNGFVNEAFGRFK